MLARRHVAFVHTILPYLPPAGSNCGRTSSLNLIRVLRAQCSEATKPYESALGPEHDSQMNGVVSRPRRSFPRMLMLQGIPGSGKSTFARRLEEEGNNWVRVCQDVLKTRQRCIDVSELALSEGKNVVIDRCNFNRAQRESWIRIAQEEGIYIGCIVFAIPYATCSERIRNRQDHETLMAHEPEKNEMVLQRMASATELPHRNEGIDFCRYVRNESDVERVLKAVMQ